MQILRRRRKNCQKDEAFLLAGAFAVVWAVAVIYNFTYNNAYVKSKYVQKSDEQFLAKYDTYYKSSVSSHELMVKYLKTVANRSNLLFNEPHNNNNNTGVLCVGILSEERDSAQINYPFQTTISLLSRIKIKYEDRVRIDLLNVDSFRSKHLRADLSLLRGLVNIVDLKVNVAKSASYLFYRKLKEAADYANAFEYYARNRSECEFVLLLEDDTIASLNWYELLANALGQIVSNHDRDWFCLKLFTSYRFYDWIVHPRTLFKYALTSGLLALVSIGAFLLVRNKKSTSVWSLALLVANSTLVIFWLHSVSISPLGYGIRQFSIGFNTVANVYPRMKLAMISNFMRNHVADYLSGVSKTFEPKDILLNKFKRTLSFEEFIVEPAIFQHVGVQSSLSASKFNPNGIWHIQYRPFQSYSFEKEYSALIQFNVQYWLSP
jgi:hypothetical protein